MGELKMVAIVIALALALAFLFGGLRPSAEELRADHPEWSALHCQRIADRQIWIGMTDDQARLSVGYPTRVNRSVGAWGVHEQWVYGYTYLYFEGGILTSWQD